jgi:hypothetical protein
MPTGDCPEVVARCHDVRRALRGRDRRGRGLHERGGGRSIKPVSAHHHGGAATSNRRGWPRRIPVRRRKRSERRRRERGPGPRLRGTRDVAGPEREHQPRTENHRQEEDDSRERLSPATVRLIATDTGSAGGEASEAQPYPGEATKHDRSSVSGAAAEALGSWGPQVALSSGPEHRARGFIKPGTAGLDEPENGLRMR